VAATPTSDRLTVRRLLRYLGPTLLFVGLTLLTQVGGIAYLLGRAIGCTPAIRARAPAMQRICVALIAITIYAGTTAFLVPPLAGAMGRVRLPCATDGGAPAVAATWLTCALNRGYVRPEVLALVRALGAAVALQFPGSQVTTPEGNLPFLDGFPLLPH